MDRLNGESDGRASTTRRWLFGAFAALGLAAMLILSVGGYKFAQVTSRIVLLSHMADQETFLVGEIAHRVDDTAAAFAQPVGAMTMASISERVTENLTALDKAMDELPPLLDEEDHPLFEKISVLISQFHDSVVRMMAASEDGYSPRSRRIFEERVLPIVSELQAPTAQLIQGNSAESARRLVELRENLDYFQKFCLLLGALFVAFLIGVAVITLRIIGKQERTIERHVATIEQANQDLDAFAGRVAHDLRGPFTPILLAASQLRSGKGGPAQVEALAARITDAVGRANRLIDGLLAFSRADHSRSNEESCSAPAAVKRALEEVAGAASAAAIELASEVEPLSVGIDDSLLEEVLGNLLRNAISHIGARPLRRVIVTAKRDEGLVRFAVADTGPGVPVEYRQRIFEPFFRLDPRLRGGVGLGLATVRRIIEAKGGSLGVDENTGGGAVFWFTLPWRPGAQAQGHVPEGRSREPSAHG